ncbi:VCBS repeat-containing protein [Candidatus Poseidoniales archaeon]|nr:VCBS repeat-containing protein [Candidatus Poseidoniales archaeon]
MSSSKNAKNDSREGRIAILLVMLMLSSPMLSLVPSVSASHITQYAVQRDPSYIAIGDIDCDNDNDIVSASSMGHFISALYNDGNGGFGDRQDVFISNNDSHRAGFRDTADGTRVYIADVDGDDVNDVVYYQQNIRFVGGPMVPGNLTILWGDCDERINNWDPSDAITVSNPYLQDMDVADIDGDGDADIVMSVIDPTFTNNYLNIFKGPDPTQITAQQTIPVPLTNGLYTNLLLGHWGEDVLGGGIGVPQTDCEDLDIWLLRTPPYNTGVGYSNGHYDNMTVLEYDCTLGTYPNPLDATASGVHNFKLDAEHNYPLYGLDISDTDDDGEVDLIAAVDGITGNISYATLSGSSWDTQNYVMLGDYLGASITIADVNRDGNMDFFVPTEVTLTRLQDSSAQNQTYLLVDNLREINTVEIILSNPTGTGYQSSISFDVGRRPTMAVPGQLAGGENSAFEIAIGQRDRSYRFANSAMWLDTQGWAGAGDFLSVLSLDNEDVGITEVTIAPAAYDPATGAAKIGEGTRFVNLTVKNTGLNPISGSIDVDLEVKEVIGGDDTLVYSNDFEGNIDSTNCASCSIALISYTGEYGDGSSSWHEEWNASTDSNGSAIDAWYEADSNPTTYMWAGMDHQDEDNQSGYYNNMDEAFIIENVDLSGSDAAYLDVDLLCTTAFFELYLAEQYSVVERWLYEDSCGIEVWSDGNGWKQVFFTGGWDNERYFRLFQLGYDPEYNTYNENVYYNTATPWVEYRGDDAIDLTPYAGEVIDIRFRFRSGLMGSVGPDGSSQDTGLDGFAFDNISIRKTDVEFGTEEVVSQTLNFNNFVAGATEDVTLTADFVDNRTYYIKTTLTGPSGFDNADETNDEVKFQITVKNLFDPGVAEEPWPSLENGLKYASGDRDIEIRVQNYGNTLTDFQLETTIKNALPDLIAIEDFSGLEPMWEDDENENGSRLDDTNGDHPMLPQSRGVFNSFAYWLGDPDTGYGDNWNEFVRLDPIPVASGGTDFTYLSFDYFAEGDFLSDSDGNILAIRDAAGLEIEWSKGGEVFQGTVWGSWTDLNENGIRPFNACEDFDNNGRYDEVEYMGDHSDRYESVVWFDSESLVKSVIIDLTHITLLNQTSNSTFDWATECTDLSGSEVTLTWRFQSNDDGVNGNAGLAGFAVDNIRIDEFTFEEDGFYVNDISGLDAAEREKVEVANHNFRAGIYRIDATTTLNTSMEGTTWYNKTETTTANNHTQIIFSIASADITLMQPNILECVSDITYKCVYTFDSVSEHSFSVPLLNGVIAGEYELMMKVVDMNSGQTVYEQSADNGPFNLDPHARDFANWSTPYSGWYDGHEYNISFYAILTEDGEQSGNDRYFEIEFNNNVDVAILSNPTDQNRLQRVKQDLESMGMSYTQLMIDDWERYATENWLDHYDKILMPWQTDYNVVYGEYYETLSATRDSDGLSVTEVLEAYMVNGGTLQIHLGPYRNEYQPNRLPFGMDIAMRNQWNNTVTNEDLVVVDAYHPLLENVNVAAFAGVHGGSYVALAGLDTAQVQFDQIPQVCGGRISDPMGTFHTLMRSESFDTQSLLSICNRGAGGMIVTTLDVENPSFSQPLGGTSMPLLSNMLSYHVTPYPTSFGIAGDGFDLTINEEAPSIDTVTGAYATMYIKSNSDLDFSFLTADASIGPSITADWTLEATDMNETVTGWQGELIDYGEISHIRQTSPSIPTLGSFCVGDSSSNTGCRIGAEWLLTLYLHDDEGHTRITYINLVTDDTLADEFRPTADLQLVENDITDEYLTQDGTKTVGGVDWPIYRVRLTDSGDISLSFDSSASSDADAPEGERGIEMFEYRVFFDYPVDSSSPTLEGHEYQVPDAAGGDMWNYVFRNMTSDGTLENQIRLELIVYDRAGKQSEKARMYFIIVGEDFGDDPPMVEITSPRSTDSQKEDLVTINGVVNSGAENGVKIEVALVETTLDLTPSPKATQKALGKYNSTGATALGDGDSFTLTLNIADLYSETTGVQVMVYWRIVEGDGSRYTIDNSFSIDLLPRPSDPCVLNPSADGCTEESGNTQMIMFAAIGVIAILAIVGVTLVLRGRGKGEDAGDTVEQFGGVEQMDPVEAYVQQMVGQGYDEATARQYAEQYYAAYYAQQGQGGGN